MAEIHRIENGETWEDRRVEKPNAVSPVHSRNGGGNSQRRDQRPPRKPFRAWLLPDHLEQTVLPSPENGKPESAAAHPVSGADAYPSLNILA